MATDFISREEALDAFAPFCKDCRFADDEKNCECCPHGYIRLKLIAIPAADVRPVVRARWENDGFYTHTNGEFARAKCSNCGWQTYAISRVVTDLNFCPNCGAYMREVTTE